MLGLVLAFEHQAALRRSLRATAEAARRRLRRSERAHVQWETARPEQEGLSGGVLDSLGASLAAEGTDAFLVVRGNHIVFEQYSAQSGPNVRHLTTAMAKAATANIAILTAITDGRISLNDLASKYVPPWRDDSVRSKIRIGDLAAHQSGLDDVDFSLAADGKLEEWKERYFHHPEQRFGMAIGAVPILFTPGARCSYSGVGYYVLAYALAASLRGAPQQDVRSLLRDRIMRPLGIPDDDWRLSYGASYQMDGMTLYAMGSGAEYTARTVARMGELILDQGRWGDRWLLDSGVVARSFRPATAPLAADSGDYRESPSAAGGGWWLNVRGTWPDVPRDAFAGFGGGHQVILVVPSLDLVMVRMGSELSSDPAQFGPAIRDRLFDPLMRAIIGPSSRMRMRSRVT